MTQRIFPMPKIEFNGNTAKCMDLKFTECECGCGDLLITGCNSYRNINELNQTFEQAVKSWVQNWIKENFEGVLVPPKTEIVPIITDSSWLSKEHIARINGFNNCRGLLLFLNPNAIVVEDV